jgi:hypothetical protein
MGELDEGSRATLAAAADRLLPGAAAAGVDDYIDQLLGAFSFDPPHIWAGGPFSGRHGGDAGFDDWIPLGPMEAHAWRQRIDGWQAQYRALLDALGTDFTAVDGEEQDRRLAAVPELRDLLYEHACEGTYGDPVYGGNRDRIGWLTIGWVGDIQPRGYTDVEVSQRERTPVTMRATERQRRSGQERPAWPGNAE